MLFGKQSGVRASLPRLLRFVLSAVVLVLSASGAELDAQVQRGRDLYLKNCFVCHQLNGEGTPGVFPPLAKSDFLLSDPERAIRALCEGLVGEITVNGRTYAGAMPATILEDAELADVLTFVLNSWGNSGGAVEK